jgi:predicted nucleotidyltransferase
MKFNRIKKEFIALIPPDLDICLMGLQGSRMLGLAQTDDADYDYRGVFLAPLKDLLGLQKPKQTIEINMGAGDGEAEFVFHEVEKFISLCMKGNPSVLHLLFIPKYNVKTAVGDLLVQNRNLFLSETAIRQAFGGYALSQILYLKRNHKFPARQKKEKHIRHCFRLFDEGQELLETGNVTVPLPHPEKYLRLQTITDDEKLVELFEQRDKEFQACKSTLPEKVNLYLINKLLLKIRGVDGRK